ncbi:MAG TPA: carboxypeptidase-like regulatory domain-containing protein [Hyphomonadaceae bacterium]|nr:carboxypeptidase-like regulatory domain-containing protein [Hyphomonadaceae bacterium]
MRDNRKAILARVSAAAGAGLLAMGLGGCIPLSMRFFNGIDTRVVDASTGQPVSGAKVTLTGRCAGAGREKAAVSDASGAVRVEPSSGLIFFILAPIDYFNPPGSLTVEATGYEKYTATQAGEWEPGSCIARPSVVQAGPPEGLPLKRAVVDSSPAR